MKKKKNEKNKCSNNFPFSSELKELRYSFKTMIDDMPDNEFLDFMLLFTEFVCDLEEYDYEEELDDEYDELPF